MNVVSGTSASIDFWCSSCPKVGCFCSKPTLVVVVVSWSLSWSRNYLACSSCLQTFEEGVFIRTDLSWAPVTVSGGSRHCWV